MLDKIYWYVLFVRANTEERLAERIKSELGSDISYPFVPQKICVLRRKGRKSLFKKICFPGYVFISSELPTAEFISQVLPVVYKLKDAYRFLCYGDKYDVAMRDEERIALSKILGKDHCIDFSIGFKEGDSVRVISGALEGNESKILRINKNRHEAVIEVALFSSMVPVSVGIEVIEEVPDTPLQERIRKNE